MVHDPRRPLLVALVLLAGSLAGCGDDQDDEGARRLLASVRADGYRNWERAPGWPSRRPTSAPHSESVDIYVNDVIGQALAAAAPLERWPEGSTIVKDGWDGSELEIIAVMQKRSDGWYFAEFDGEGDPNYSGHPKTCTNCHEGGNDSVQSFPLP